MPGQPGVVVNPTPYAVGEEKTGVAGPMTRFAAWQAMNRSGQVQNAMHTGALKTFNTPNSYRMGSGLLGWKSTDDELLKWRGGQGIIRKNLNRLTRGRISEVSSLVSGTSPSLWMQAGSVMNGTSSRNAWRMVDQWGYGNVAGNMDDIGFLRSTGEQAASWNEFNTSQGHLNTSAETRARAKQYGGYSSGPMSNASEQMAWTQQALKLGQASMRLPQSSRLAKYGLQNGAYMKDYVVGAVFNRHSADDLFAAASGAKGAAKTAYSQAARGVANAGDSWLGRAAASGRATRILSKAGLIGTEAGQVGLTMGKTAGALLRIAGAGMRWVPYVGTALMVKDVVEATWKAGDLYFSKMPRRAFSAVNSVATRPIFAPIAAGMPDSPQAANNRQRAIQAIQGSRLNARNAIGREASLMASHFG